MMQVITTMLNVFLEKIIGCRSNYCYYLCCAYFEIISTLIVYRLTYTAERYAFACGSPVFIFFEELRVLSLFQCTIIL